VADTVPVTDVQALLKAKTSSSKKGEQLIMQSSFVDSLYLTVSWTGNTSKKSTSEAQKLAIEEAKRIAAAEAKKKKKKDKKGYNETSY
jgi:hypothetical protein